MSTNPPIKDPQFQAISPQNLAVSSDCHKYAQLGRLLRERGSPEEADFFSGKILAACANYQNNEQHYSPDGQRAFQGIRPQLANGALRDAQENPKKSGIDIKTEWIQSHPEIYRQAGVCSLPLSDKARLASDSSHLLMEHPEIAIGALTGAANSTINRLQGKEPLPPNYSDGPKK